MAIEQNGAYLVGKCLIATPSLDDSEFKKSVIYMCSHSDHGAMGLIINFELKDINFDTILSQLNISQWSVSASKDIIIHTGGPLNTSKGFILHSTDYTSKDSLLVDSSYAVTATVDILEQIASGGGPKHSLIALGYAAWEAGQLERELKDNSWLVTDANPEIIFNTNDSDKWDASIKNMGIDLSKLSMLSGRA